MLFTAQITDDAVTRALSLETAQSAVNRLVFSDSDRRHSFQPSFALRIYSTFIFYRKAKRLSSYFYADLRKIFPRPKARPRTPPAPINRMPAGTVKTKAARRARFPALLQNEPPPKNKPRGHLCRNEKKCGRSNVAPSAPRLCEFLFQRLSRG